MGLRVLRVSKTPLKPHPTVYGVDRPSGTEVHLSNAMLCDGLGALGGLSVSIDRCVLHDDAGGGLKHRASRIETQRTQRTTKEPPSIAIFDPGPPTWKAHRALR